MGRRLLLKFKEALYSVLPISILVLVLSLTPIVNLSSSEIITFIISSMILIFGIALFNLGADLAIEPMGKEVGSTLVKTKRMKLILIVCFVLGVLITIAEPDLSVLANQLKDAMPNILGLDGNYVLIISVGLGVGLFLVLGVLKIITKRDLSQILLFFYMMLFCLASILIFTGKWQFLAVSFDSGGVTTGPVTVPFLMALGAGFALTIGGRDSKENSFGLIALSSIGPIIIVVLLGLSINYTKLGDLVDTYNKTAITNYNMDTTFNHILNVLISNFKDILIALALVFMFFFVIDLIFIKLPKKSIKIMLLGLCYALVGLVLFLTAAQIGFLPIGFKIGQELANYRPCLVIISFLIGMLTVLAEPAVRILTHQVDEVTLGAISRKTLLIALSIGVGISLMLSMIRIIFDFSILYYVIPGYLICFGLSFFVPKIYTAIAFDAGGVASGPLTTSFVLPLSIGACSIINDYAIFENAYGIVAMVALTPLITIQLLGFKSVASRKMVELKRKKVIEKTHDDNVFINF